MEKLLAILGAVLVMFSFSFVGFAKEATTGAFNWTEQNIGRPILLGSYTGEVIAIDQNAQSAEHSGKGQLRKQDLRRVQARDEGYSRASRHHHRGIYEDERDEGGFIGHVDPAGGSEQHVVAA